MRELARFAGCRRRFPDARGLGRHVARRGARAFDFAAPLTRLRRRCRNVNLAAL
eukprot:CAMPEP_0206836702 /NCGR_PEP_ID=MMETSP0975-20121206/20030_1 /ASSEMBLY_ACC=CAM_ASM_000399 /TAXON_ID=483370 /ORGANISM="non described non described, Strain CCMP2097" /LENGTH=53 /DNA_ID=CAMNT_0054379105 /DNA_START=53 /DNA_END=210 /DNA_ORIENTATION=+